MKMLRKLVAFILVFCLLAGTVAAMSAAVYVDDAPALAYSVSASPESSAKPEPAATAASGYTPRLTAPAHTNKYYYSDMNVLYMYGWPMPNCVTYAWGRAYEILKTAPDLCIYSAYLWYDYNKDNHYYPYGTEPRLGAIACWVYTSGTSGHVAVVEKIEDGEITFSNSAYGGTEFYTNTAPIDDPSDGRETWIFQGYIYIGDFGGGSSAPPATEPPADDTVDTSTADVYRIDTEGGVNLRLGPGTSYPVVGFIDDGQTAKVTETRAAGGYTWGKTVYDGVAGWFALDYAKLIYRGTPDDPDPPDDDSSSLKYMRGDLDSDGYVSIMDATRIQLIVADMYVPTKYMLTVGDYDGDSFFSIMDAGRIRHDIAYDLV